MIIADADFLSAFLKIERLNLVFEVFHVKEIVITGGVLHELGQAPVHQKLLKALHLQEHKVIVKDVETVTSGEFGKGEMESVALAVRTKALLLMDDRRAGQYAEKRGVTVLSIPMFLLYCKTKSILSNDDIKKIIGELKEKDHYEFGDEAKRRLLD